MPVKPDPSVESPARTRPARRIAVAAVTLVSVAWVAVLLVRAWPELLAHIHELRPLLLLLGLALSVGSAYLTFEAFATLVGAIGIAEMPRLHLAHLHFTSQLLKHLPGRVWGVGYQWSVGSASGTLGDWVVVNVGHMLLATFFALWSACLALAMTRGAVWCSGTFAGGLVAYVIGWALVSSASFQQILGRLPGKAGGLKTSFAMLSTVPGAARLRIFLFFCGSWVLYYAAWFSFGDAYPALGSKGGVTLCAYYMVAWFVGYVSLLTPSGLGVRELAFAWMAHDFGNDVIALMSIVGRVSLLAVDILLGLVFSPFAPRRN